MPVTNFPNGISSFGVPVMGGGGIPATTGTVFWVDYTNGSDANSGRSPARAFRTVAKAYDSATTNKDDVICLIGSASHVVTEMLTISKNRVHFVGVDGLGGRLYGQNAKISMGVTTAATDLGAVKNTGIRNSFTNIKFTSANTVAQSLYTFLEGGEYTVFNNCEFYKSTDLDQSAAAEFVCNGDSPQFIDCTFGSLADFQTGTTIRPSVLMTKEVVGTGLVTRDAYFRNCRFWKNAGHVNGRHVYGANATDVERIVIFDNCVFANAVNAAAVPAQCVAFGATLTVGQVLVKDCTSINNTKLSTTTGVLIAGAVPTYATTGIAVQS